MIEYVIIVLDKRKDVNYMNPKIDPQAEQTPSLKSVSVEIENRYREKLTLVDKKIVECTKIMEEALFVKHSCINFLRDKAINCWLTEQSLIVNRLFDKVIVEFNKAKTQRAEHSLERERLIALMNKLNIKH